MTNTLTYYDVEDRELGRVTITDYPHYYVKRICDDKYTVFEDEREIATFMFHGDHDINGYFVNESTKEAHPLGYLALDHEWRCPHPGIQTIRGDD